MALTINQLIIYPIKSLGGVSVSEAVVEAGGLRHDRRYMLVEPSADGQSDTFITQRTVHRMALIEVSINVPDNELRVWHRHSPADVLTLPLVPPPTPEAPVSVTIWDSEDVPAQGVDPAADAWFSRVFEKPCRLVYMPDTTRRAITSRHTRPNDVADPIVSFADGFPLLLITQSSLDELNRRLADSVDEPLTMARFRPNMIVEGLCWPHDEDTWAAADLGGAMFYGVKPCVRCVLTTLDPATGERGKEPLRTLATYRRTEAKILFGENFMPDLDSVGQTIRVGESVRVLERKEPWLPIGV